MNACVGLANTKFLAAKTLKHYSWKNTTLTTIKWHSTRDPISNCQRTFSIVKTTSQRLLGARRYVTGTAKVSRHTDTMSHSPNKGNPFINGHINFWLTDMLSPVAFITILMASVPCGLLVFYPCHSVPSHLSISHPWYVPTSISLL